MAKSLVEKYQQILEQDPGSLVFVELAKALLDRGDARQALDVCTRGVEQHPDSIVGRVLWGKALITIGKPAEAMEQFDKAIAIERENPYAYNLIGEVLLHKGLFRSALPILRKAVSLQPGDARVRQWMDQAQRGVSGGGKLPPEVDMTKVDLSASPTGSKPAGDQDSTLVDVQAYVPGPTAPPAPANDTISGLTDIFQSLSARQGSSGPSEPPPSESTVKITTPLAEQPPPSSDSAVATGPEVVSGLTDQFKTLSGAPESSDKIALPSQPPPQVSQTEVPFPTTNPDLTDPGAPPPGASSAPSSLLPDFGLPADADPETTAPGAPPDAAPPAPAITVALPTAEAAKPPEPAPSSTVQISADLFAPPPIPKPPPVKKTGLLADLPEDGVPNVSQEVPSVMIAPEAAQDIAREYERELRERLLKTPPPSFLRKHWLAVSLSTAVTLALAAGIGIYLHVRHKNRGFDLIELRSQSFRALTLDTPPALRDAIDVANRALELAPEDSDTRAARAFAEAALYFRAGREPGRRTAAQKDLAIVQQGHEGLAKAMAYYLATDPAELDAAKGPILSATADKLPKGFEGAEVLAIAGKLLMASNRAEEALARFKSALETDPNHVGTLSALGEYYLSQSDYEQALKFFGRAKELSPGHVPALLGVIKARLAMDEGDPSAELAQAQKAFASAAGAWPAGWEADLDLAEGRVLALQGKRADATSKLSAGAGKYPARAADFFAALGAAESVSGNYDKAEAAYQRALEKKAGDGELKENLARSLIALGKPMDAIRRTEPMGADERRLRVVRGLARLEAGQYAKAREELTQTMRNGKVPTEAAIYLAMIDAATGQRDTARTVLENAVRSGKGRAMARVALGRIYVEDGKEKDATVQFTAATEDKRDWEGACSLGKLALKKNRFADAQTQFALALDRNHFHQEAHVGMGQTLLALGEAAKAQASFQQALTLGPSGAARRGVARALLAQGDLSGARKELALATKAEPKDPELPRLWAQLALASGDAQEAIKSLDKASRANPTDPEGFCELGELLVKVGNQPVARKIFETALKLDKTGVRARLGMVSAWLPTVPKALARDADALVKETDSAEPRVKARALALQARVKLAGGDAKSGYALAETAVKADDASADAHLAMGLAANSAKHPDQALKELQRVVGLDPTLAEAHLALSVALARDPNELQHALSEAESYLRIAPTGPDAPMAKKLTAALKKKVESAE